VAAFAAMTCCVVLGRMNFLLLAGNVYLGLKTSTRR
jgi:hypothetical protein